MAHIPIDASIEADIFETPIIPSGTVVTLQIADEPELTESNNRPGAYLLNLRFKVVEAKDKKHIGVTLFHTQCVPGPVYRDNVSTEGYRMMCDSMARLCSACGIPADKRDTQRFVSKKVKATLKIEEYEGVQRNKVGGILGKA